MLNWLTTKNFKKLNNHHFDFADGLNVIVGDNAAGKTTLTYAIAFALFGVRAIPSKAENIPTWGTKDVEVKLSVKDCVITRTLKNCTVEKNGEPVAVGNTPCSAYIEANITGLDYKGFKMFNWSGQDETAALLTIGATQLQRDIEKFSGVQFIDNIIKTASKDLALIDNELEGAERIDLTEKYKERDRLEADLGDLNDQHDGAVYLLGEATDQLTEAETALAEGKRVNKQRQELDRVLADCDSRIESAETTITDLKAEKSTLPSVEWEGEVALAEAKSTLSAARRLNEEHRSKSERRQRLSEQLLELRSEEEADIGRQKRLDELTAAVEKKTIAASEAKSASASLKAICDDLSTSLASGVCAKCGRPFEGYDAEETQRELTQAEVSAENAAKAYAASTKEANAAKEALRAAEPVSGSAARIPAVNAEIAETAQWLLDNEVSDLAGLEEQVERLSIEKAAAEAAKETAEKLQRLLTKAEASLSSAKNERADAGEQLMALPESADLDALQMDVTGLTMSLSNLKLEEQRLSNKGKELDSALTAVNVYINDSLSYNAEVEKLSKESALLTSFVKFLRESRVTFLASVWDQILGFASGFVSETTQGVISAITKSDDGFEFCEDGVYAPAEAASGAQKGFIGVAMRIAMAESLRVGLPSIILDEPSAAMRENNAMLLAGGLLGQEQVLMITHRESDQVSGSSIIEV